MLRIAICDDDVNFTGTIEEILRERAFVISIDIEIEIFFDGLQLEKYIYQGNRYDLIYLDIEMEYMNGIEAARHIRELDKSVLLIYISGYEQYLKDLFEIEPFRFLSKPLDVNKFLCYFEEAYLRIKECNSYYQFAFRKEVRKIALKDIIYFESRGRLIHIFYIEGEEYFYGKLNEVEKELKENNQFFLRIHQSFLINYDYVRKMNYSSVVIKNSNIGEIVLQISEDRQKKIKMQLCSIVNKR